MADFKELISLFLSNQSRVKFSFESMTYIDSWLPGYFDISATLELPSGTFSGRSVGESEILASGKALIEAIERATTVRFRNRKMSGFAAHFSALEASRSASLELIERDAVLAHFHSATPFNTLPRDVLKNTLGPKYSSFEEKSNLRSVEWSLYCAESRAQSAVTVICVGRKKNGSASENMIFGFGVSYISSTPYGALIAACRRALLECVQNVPALLGEINFSKTSLSEFNKKNHWESRDHGTLGFDTLYTSKIGFLFSEKIEHSEILNTNKYSTPSFQTTNLKLPDELSFVEKILHVVSVTSDTLIPLYVGPPPKHSSMTIPHFIG